MLQTSVNTGCEKKRDAKRETGSNMMVGELDRTQTHVHNNPGHFWVSQFSPTVSKDDTACCVTCILHIVPWQKGH